MSQSSSLISLAAIMTPGVERVPELVPKPCLGGNEVRNLRVVPPEAGVGTTEENSKDQFLDVGTRILGTV